MTIIIIIIIIIIQSLIFYSAVYGSSRSANN